MARIGIEAISVFGLPPLEYVHLAADLDCRCISTGLTAFPYNPHGYPPFSLRDDPTLRREMIAMMRDLDITISLGEGLLVMPEGDVANYANDLDIFAGLGTERINTVSMDPDLGRTFDQFARLAEMAHSRGLRTTTELSPSLTVADLPTALAAVRHVGRADFNLLIDTMHLVRSGSDAVDIAAVAPRLIDYIQLSDAPLQPRFDSYFEEAMFERLVPGKGELSLSSIIAVLPGDRVFSLEIPLRSEAEGGSGPRERLAKCVSAARVMLAEAGHTVE